MIYRKVLFIESCSSFVHIATQSDQAAVGGFQLHKTVESRNQPGSALVLTLSIASRSAGP